MDSMEKIARQTECISEALGREDKNCSNVCMEIKYVRRALIVQSAIALASAKGKSISDAIDEVNGYVTELKRAPSWSSI